MITCNLVISRVFLCLKLVCLFSVMVSSLDGTSTIGDYEYDHIENYNSEGVAHFVKTYLEYKPICDKVNQVIPRNDGYNLNLARYRDWTLNAGLLHQFLDISPLDHTFRRTRSFCQSVDEVKYAMSLPVSEHPCTISWFSPAHACHVLHKYSMVIMFGDSLTRHSLQTLMMLLKGDLRYGGIPGHQDTQVYDNCSCDGQFSGALLCRKPMTFHIADTFHTGYTMDSLESEGYCSMYMPPFNRHTSIVWVQNNYVIDLKCPSDDRPIFFYIQGGVHCDQRLDLCINGYFGPFIKKVKEQLKECFHKVKILFSGSTVCSDEVAKKYPIQNREIVKRYNAAMTTWFSKNYVGSQSIDFWNLTAETLNRTSDGFHQLTDANLIKITGILSMMNHMASSNISSDQLQ